LAIVWSCALGVSAYATAVNLVVVPEQVCPTCWGKGGWPSSYCWRLRQSGVWGENLGPPRALPSVRCDQERRESVEKSGGSLLLRGRRLGL